MPKALSRKVQEKSTKKQNCITQYFQTIPSISAEQKQSVEDIHERSLRASKRKTASILNCESFEFSEKIGTDEPCSASKKAKNQRVTNFEKLNSDAKKLDDINVIDLDLSSSERVSLNIKSENVNIDQNSDDCNKHIDDKINMLRNLEHIGSPINYLSPVKHQDKENSSGLRFSPKVAELVLTPQKDNRRSPVKAKVLLDIANVDFDNFNEEWSLGEIVPAADALDLSTIQRCEVMAVTKHPTFAELLLKNSLNKQGSCFLEGLWCTVPISPGDIVSVIAHTDSTGRHVVNNTSGLIILNPDQLLSTTSIVGAVFCRRKAVLQERFKGIDSANIAMTIGVLVHELVQKALTKHINDIPHLKQECENLLKSAINVLYDAGITLEEARSSIDAYILSLYEFIQAYIKNGIVTSKDNIPKGKWDGHIDKVLDIEENVYCPQLGLKGKIDATLEVTIHERIGRKKAVVPMELKSGRASGSVEHRGQLVLYGMMMAAQRGADPAHEHDERGLLLYLKDRVDLREINCGYPERRDLIMLRNQLVQYLAPNKTDYERLTNVEEATKDSFQDLPEPIYHETACSKCPYLTLCSLHLWNTPGPQVSEKHPLSKIKIEALSHLSPEHISYFLHWSTLLRIEERKQISNAPLSSLWTQTPAKRSKRGTCAANLKLLSVEASDQEYVHVFTYSSPGKGIVLEKPEGPQEGEFVIVNIESRPWIAAGTVLSNNNGTISVLLERNLNNRHSENTLFHLDTYESYASTVQNLTNLGVLMENSVRASSMRSLIIDKKPPEFEKNLKREVGRIGAKLMKSLNIEQQRAVLRAISAKQYSLLQGLPGTGKTQTVSVLIQMLVALGQRVLVTAHTHSAVDTVLIRLPSKITLMRLGSIKRVALGIQSRCERKLTENCTTPDELAKLYDSMEVVGVTCLGSNHPLLARTTFDVCIVDEATQVLQCTVLRPLLAAKRFVLVGDPDQLPPVVRSRAARKLGMEESLFARLCGTGATATLQLQYRMNCVLAELANRVAYNGRLKCATDDVKNAKLKIDIEKIKEHYEANSPWILSACCPSIENTAIALDTGLIQTPMSESTKFSCANRIEALIVLAVLNGLRIGGVTGNNVGIIAPYRDQVSIIKEAVLKLYKGEPCAEVSTVDQFQGRDKPVIVYSCTKTVTEGDTRDIKEGEVLTDPRRLAVGVTRARHKLIVIGDATTLRRYEPLAKLLNNCNILRLPNNEEFYEKLNEDYGHML